jgi:phospho-N-acetylmuramoyl-pentapeptide-transferase
MANHVVIPVLISFALSVIMGPVVIPFLRRLKVGQTERAEGVQSHLKKAGTPTMGGVMILLSVVATSLFYVKDYPKIIPVLFLTVGFGLIGFLDDFLKVVMKRSDGLFPGQKMALQIVVTAVFAFYIVKVAEIPLTLLIPFSGGQYWDIGWGSSSFICGCHRDRERDQFYRRAGRPCIQRDCAGGYLFYGSSYRDGERD